MKTINKNNTEKQVSSSACYAFCPICGADLYYQDDECICKNKECTWVCNNCHKPI